MEAVTEIEKLDWFPLYVYVLMTDEMWERPDYEFGWYMKLLIRCVHSKRRGYLPVTPDLYRLAGARSRQFFAEKNAVVMARFKVCQIDGQDYLYNPKLLKVLSEQSTKYRRNPQKLDVPSLSLSVVGFDELQKAIERLFDFYVKVFERDARYKLTDQREKKCALRLQELMRDNGGDLAKAESAAREAIEKLSLSEWHRDNGHIDWLEQIFRSQEEFQKRLCMVRPLEKKTAAAIGYQGESSPFDWKTITEEERYAWADLHWRKEGKDENRIPEYMRPYLKVKA